MSIGDPPHQSGPDLRPLAAEAARQAVPSIRGYLHQLWWSVDAWLQLRSADEVIFLEGAEDLDKLRADGAITEQVKSEAATISLNDQRAHTVLQNFWTTSQKEPTRQVVFHYVSTARAANEKDGAFGEPRGIDAWRIARHDVAMAAVVQKYLAKKIPENTDLGAFLAKASPEEFQSRIVNRFHWFLEQPDISDIKERIRDRLRAHPAIDGIALGDLQPVVDRLYNHVCDVAVKPNVADRRLTLGELNRQIQSATTVNLAISISQFKQVFAALGGLKVDPGEALLQRLKLPVPASPALLLTRPALVQHIRALIEARKTVLQPGDV